MARERLESSTCPNCGQPKARNKWDIWVCVPCTRIRLHQYYLTRGPRAHIEAAPRRQIEPRPAPPEPKPKPEVVHLPCWRERRDYFAAMTFLGVKP
jgi:hypothetical protein